MLRLLIAAACALALLAAGCGGDDDPAEPPAQAPAADLTVTVRPEGPGGPVRRRRIECTKLGADAPEPACQRLAGLAPEQFAPVPPETACTQIYGGPASARVTGELLGKRVDARFERTDGCQIERWERNRVLLGDPARPG